MGCHTWFYIHIPEKKYEWEKLFIDSLKKKIKECDDSHKATTEEEWKEEFQDIVVDNTNQRNFWRNITEKQKKELIESKEADEYDIDGNIKLFSCNTWEEFKQIMIEDTEKALKQAETLHTLQDLLTPETERLIDSYSLFLPFEIKEEKIYVDAGSNNIDDFPELVEEIDPIVDVFRIGEYDAEPCHTLEECEETCKKYNNKPLTSEQREILRKHFEKYPDTIVEFG